MRPDRAPARVLERSVPADDAKTREWTRFLRPNRAHARVLGLDFCINFRFFALPKRGSERDFCGPTALTRAFWRDCVRVVVPKRGSEHDFGSRLALTRAFWQFYSFFDFQNTAFYDVSRRWTLPKRAFRMFFGKRTAREDCKTRYLARGNAAHSRVLAMRACRLRRKTRCFVKGTLPNAR